MPITRRTAALGLLATSTVGSAAPALAADPPGAPIAKVFPYLDRYWALPAADRAAFRMVYVITPKKGTVPTITIVRNGVSEPLRLGPGGVVQNLPDLATLKSDARLVANPPGSATMSMTLEPVLPKAREQDAARVREIVGRTNAAIRKAAGVAGFAVPRMKGVLFVGAGSGHALLPGGAKLALPVRERGVVYEPDAKATAAAQTLELAAVPTALRFA